MNKKLKVLALTKYDKKGASSRLRSIQYFKAMQDNNIFIAHSPLFDDTYLENLYNEEKISKLYIMARYVKRFIKVCTYYKYDLLWIEKELFPWLPFNIEGFLNLLGVRYLVDYDDAVFHNYDQHKSSIVRYFLSNKIPNVMKNATLVTVCNSYLRQKALDSGTEKVEIIPTVVDLDRYNTMYNTNNSKLTIGWIGTPKTEKYIIELIDVFEKLIELLDFKILVIGGKNFKSDKFKYEVVTWSEDRESDLIRQIDVGIMPLTDSKWEQGKCGYKLIQYMASGKPVVASAIGMNCEIVRNDENGYTVSSANEWMEAFIKLSDTKKRTSMGQNARKDIEQKYSLEATLRKKIESILDTAT